MDEKPHWLMHLFSKTGLSGGVKRERRASAGRKDNGIATIDPVFLS
jgi:hypothetical protein